MFRNNISEEVLLKLSNAAQDKNIKIIYKYMPNMEMINKMTDELTHIILQCQNECSELKESTIKNEIKKEILESHRRIEVLIDKGLKDFEEQRLERNSNLL